MYLPCLKIKKPESVEEAFYLKFYELFIFIVFLLRSFYETTSEQYPVVMMLFVTVHLLANKNKNSIADFICTLAKQNKNHAKKKIKYAEKNTKYGE
jgi:hypothetical protein